MKLIVVILCTCILQACSVYTKNPDNITPDSNIGSKLPINATIMLYVRQTTNKTLLREQEISLIQFIKRGENLTKVGLSISKKYFKKTKPLNSKESTHYVLKLQSKTKFDIILGFYTSEVHGILFNSSGKIVYEDTTSSSSSSLVIGGENVIVNNYISATKEYFDKLFSIKENEINLYISSNKKAVFDTNKLVKIP